MEGEGMGNGFHEDVDTLEELLNGLVAEPNPNPDPILTQTAGTKVTATYGGVKYTADVSVDDTGTLSAKIPLGEGSLTLTLDPATGKVSAAFMPEIGMDLGKAVNISAGIGPFVTVSNGTTTIDLQVTASATVLRFGPSVTINTTQASAATIQALTDILNSFQNSGKSPLTLAEEASLRQEGLDVRNPNLPAGTGLLILNQRTPHMTGTIVFATGQEVVDIAQISVALGDSRPLFIFLSGGAAAINDNGRAMVLVNGNGSYVGLGSGRSTVLVSGSGNFVDASAQTGSAAVIAGGGNYVQMGSNSTVLQEGSYNTVVTGVQSALTTVGNHNQAFVGTGSTVLEGGNQDYLSASDGSSVFITGTQDLAEVGNGAAILASGSSNVLYAGNQSTLTVVGTSDYNQVGAGSLILDSGALNFVQTGDLSTLFITGVSDYNLAGYGSTVVNSGSGNFVSSGNQSTIYAAGTGNYSATGSGSSVYVTGAGDAVATSGSTVLFAPGAQAPVYGSGNTIYHL